MLEIIQRYPSVHPVRMLSACSISHMDLSANDRADLATDWLDHRLIVLPSLKLAAQTFNSNSQSIWLRRKNTVPASLAAALLSWALLHATPDEITAVFSQNEGLISVGLESVWDAQR